MNKPNPVKQAATENHFSLPGHRPESAGRQRLDAIINRLSRGSRVFAGLNLGERITLAESMQKGVLATAQRSVAAGCRAKGIPAESTLVAEDWSSGPMSVVRHLRLVRGTLEQIRSHGQVRLRNLRQTPDGRVAVQVFPLNAIDRLLFKDVRVETWMQAGMSKQAVQDRCGGFYREASHDGCLVLVLGAGNIPGIPLMDVVTKMFNEGKVCLLKMNPVNEYLGPYIEEAFAEAIRRDFLAVVYGGADTGEYLARHDGIDEVHLTGSQKTYDAIVRETAGEEQADRGQSRREPALLKPISAELGNVSPVIIMPGPYSRKQLAFQAEDLAGSLSFNAGFLCCSPVVVLTHRDWPERETFFALLEQQLARIAPRRAFYPGAPERWHSITAGRENVRCFGQAGPNELPWALIRELDSAGDDPLFRNEPFCPVLAEVPIDADNPVEFLARATLFANQRLWGTLTANLIVHPRTMKDPDSSAAVYEALQDLCYGTITVNSSFSGMAFAFSSPPWGAWQGSGPVDMQSGSGWVHNTLMLEGVEKTVAWFPITSFPKPVYFPSHRTADSVVRRLTALEENAHWSKVPGVILAAMRG